MPTTRRTPESAPPAKGPRQLKPLPQQPASAPAPVTYAIALAVRALREGTASAEQQKMALEWVVAEACAKRHSAYHQNDRDTCFALGRLFVADQITGLLHVDLSTLRRDL